jgi:hypothetical protein
MNTLHLFVACSRAALQSLFVQPFGWVTFALFLDVNISTIASFYSRDGRSRPIRGYLFPLLLLVAFPATIAIGIFFRAPSVGHLNHTGAALLVAVGLSALVFGIYCVYRCKGIRWFAATVVAAELWIILAAASISGVYVAGIWS